jgi:integrase
MACAVLHVTYFGCLDDDRKLLINLQGHPLIYNSLAQRMKRLGEKAKKRGVLRKNLHFTAHSLRRFYGTTLYEKGMGLKAIQRLTRHQSIDILMKYYIHDEQPSSPIFDQILKVNK